MKSVMVKLKEKLPFLNVLNVFSSVVVVVVAAGLTELCMAFFRSGDNAPSLNIPPFVPILLRMH